MKKIPMLERFAAQSLVEHDGELIFSKEKFAELIVRECARIASNADLEDVEGGDSTVLRAASEQIKRYFGVES